MLRPHREVLDGDGSERELKPASACGFGCVQPKVSLGRFGSLCCRAESQLA